MQRRGPGICLALVQVTWGWLGAVLPRLAWPMLDGRNVMLAARDDRLAGGLSSVKPSFLMPALRSWLWGTLGSAAIPTITTSLVLRARAGARGPIQCNAATLVDQSVGRNAGHDPKGP